MIFICVTLRFKILYKQTNKHTPANAFGIGPAHKEQESQRSSLVTQTSVSET